MNLVSLNIESIQLGHPLPFVLRGADGGLLAQKGYVIRTREELAKMVGRGRQLCVDTDESGDSHRAYLAQLQRMLIADTNLGEIAAMKMTAADDAGGRGRTGKTLPDWPELQLRATQLLRAPSPADFGGRFQKLQDQLAQQTHPLTAQQIAAVESHAERSEALLRTLGVADPVWLEAVRCHD